MPGGNGTGPSGEGPMTGRGMGFCVLKKDAEDPSHFEGFIGIEGKPYKLNIQDKKEVIIMPRGDGTGPAGMGPMTGRAAGYCAGYPVPGFANPIRGRGFGSGYSRGLGLGFRQRRWAVPYFGYGYGPPYTTPYVGESTPQQEIETLQDQAKYLETTLEGIKKRITELETVKTEK